MFRRQPKAARAFTLVEMLVVLGIIAVLVALLMPAVMSAVNSARRAKIATELSQLSGAVEAYKNDKGDYPPNFRDYNAFIRHIRRAYPKIAPTRLDEMITYAWGQDSSGNNYTLANPPPTSPAAIPLIDEGESLVLWLSAVDGDSRDPFKVIRSIQPTSAKRYYQFDERRLINTDSDVIPSYRAAYSKETSYIYMDSRSYDELIDIANGRAAIADGASLGVRPYWQNSTTDSTSVIDSSESLPMNPTTFQIVCAGQDGEFGTLLTDSTENNVKKFNSGQHYAEGDMDNMTNFSDGKRLEDNIP